MEQNPTPTNETEGTKATEGLARRLLGAIVAKASRSTMVITESDDGHWFWGAFRSDMWSYGQIALAATMINTFSLATSLFIMTVYDRVIPNNAIDSLIALAIGMALVLFFDFTLRTLRAYFIDVAGQRADITLARRIFNKILDMSLVNRGGSTGGMANRFREFETLREFFTSATLAALVDLPFTFWFLVIIGLIGGPLVLVPGLAVPFVLLIGLLVQPFFSRLSDRALEQGQSKQGTLVETIAGLETIKTVAAAPMMRDRWLNAVQEHSNIGMRSRIFGQLAINSASFAQQASQVGIVIYGVFLVSAGELSMGQLIACVILSSRALAPLAQLANILARANQALSSFKALDSFMKEPGEKLEGQRYLRRPSLEGKIEFRHVTFTYPGQAHRALDDVSFVIQPGQKVAILGRVGSGKSTIMRLLLGLYVPDTGTILVDNTDIRQIHPDDLRSAIGSVLQDIFLFSGTIRENIAVGTTDATDDDILKAAALSGAHDFIGQLSTGYDQVLKDRGEGLSGGQRQAIAIARSVIGTPSVMVFDEPTSAMDAGSERQLIDRLKPFLANRSMVLITHRTPLLELTDRVIIIERGKLAADGPKEKVLARLRGETVS